MEMIMENIDLLNFAIGCVVAFFTTVDYHLKEDNKSYSKIEIATMLATYYIIIYHWPAWLICLGLWKLDKKLNK